MPSASTLSSSQQGQGRNSQLLHHFLAQLRELSSGPGFQNAMEILDNISKLQNEVQNKDDELTRTREEMLERVTKKQTAIDEMFEANEKEKAKQKEIMMRIDSLEKTIITRDKEFAEQKSLTDNLTVQIEKLRSDYAKKTSDLTEARKDIDNLRQNVRDRDTIIEKMKSAGSELKRVLSTAKEKVKELEDEKAALQKSHKAKELRLNRLEGFAAALHNEEEDKMYVHCLLCHPSQLDSANF